MSLAHWFYTGIQFNRIVVFYFKKQPKSLVDICVLNAKHLWRIPMWQVAEGRGGFEPQTPQLQGMRTNHLAKVISLWPSGQNAWPLEYGGSVTATPKI